MKISRFNVPREAFLEKTCCRLAKQNGWLTYKWVSISHRGVPDRIFIKSGRIVLVEFKSSAGRITELQRRTFEQMSKEGVHVNVIRSVEEFKHAIA